LGVDCSAEKWYVSAETRRVLQQPIASRLVGTWMPEAALWAGHFSKQPRLPSTGHFRRPHRSV